MLMVDIILMVLLIVVCLGSMMLTVFQLPGTWIVLAAAVGYAWYGGWQRIGWPGIAVLGGIAALAELAELGCALWFAKRGGASRRAAWYGLAGGILGAFVLTVPVPVIGTVVGAALGCFAGALVGELSLNRSVDASARVGVYAALGRTVGSVLKICAVVVMSGIVVVTLIL
ncbi:MAG: DUF456 domain-containing protein [bacterium]|nr:DUF456 domain-containing protein [bacterium]